MKLTELLKSKRQRPKLQAVSKVQFHFHFVVDPKKQIYISKFDIDGNNNSTNKTGEEVAHTQAHIKNLRKKDYYENRIKKGFM